MRSYDDWKSEDEMWREFSDWEKRPAVWDDAETLLYEDEEFGEEEEDASW
jgi:hypothetical protein